MNIKDFPDRWKTTGQVIINGQEYEMTLKEAVHIYLHPYDSGISGQDIINARTCIVSASEKFTDLLRNSKSPPPLNLISIIRSFLSFEYE